jgi:hypothetical protein
VADQTDDSTTTPADEGLDPATLPQGTVEDELRAAEAGEDDDAGEQAKKRAQHFDEHALALPVDDPVPPRPDQLVHVGALAVGNDRGGPAVERSDDRGAGIRRVDPPQLGEDGVVEQCEMDVDLAAARKAGVPGLLVGDAVRQELRGAAGQDLLRLLVDLVLDTAAGHGARELPARRHGELCPDRTRRGPAGGD